jgi:hypothetical protein
MSKRNEVIEQVINTLEDANYLVQSELHDAEPERAQEIAYLIMDVVDRVACMEEEEDEGWVPGDDNPENDFNYVGHPAHY